MLGRWVSDLETGDVLPDVVYQLSPFAVREYCHGVEEAGERFHHAVGDRPQVAPPTMVHLDKLRVLAAGCPEGAGPTARMQLEYHAEHFAEVVAGSRLRASGRVEERTEPGGLERLLLVFELHEAETDRLLIRYRDVSLLNYGARRRDRPRPGGREPATEVAVARESASGRWPAGRELGRRARAMTAERMRWHCDGLESALADRLVQSGPNIHTDDEVARANGLPGRVADGMISTNWLSGVLVEAFGDDYLCRGSLRTRYVRPVLVDDPLEAVVTVRTATEGSDGQTDVTADVRCQTPDGRVCTVGEATIGVRAAMA